MTEENERRGRRNRVAGKKWQADCAAWLRDHGWPSASYDIRNNLNDLLGTWDLAIETTITEWDKIPWKVEVQAAEGAARRGLPYPVVWKKRNGKQDPGKGLAVMVFEIFHGMALRLEELERQEMDAELAFERGFRLGQKQDETAALRRLLEIEGNPA